MTSEPQAGFGARLKRVLAVGGVAVVRAAVDALRPTTDSSDEEIEPGPDEPFSWRRVLDELRARIKEQNVPFLAAGLAYYGILAIVPGLIATVSLYGLVADPSDAARLVENLGDAAPAEVRSFIDGQLNSVIETSPSGLGVSLAISILGALWAASNGTKALIRGINIAYGIDETRGLVKLRVVSVLFTVGLVGAVGAILAVVTFGHRFLGGNRWFNPILEYGRWPLILAVVVVILAGFYRLAPARRQPGWSVASLGAVVAAISWVVASIGLSIYVSRFGSFNETYGTLGAIIVVLLWLFVSAFVVLLGAVLDSAIAEIRRTSSDSG